MKRFIISLTALLCANLAIGQVQYTDINPDATVTTEDEMGYPLTIAVGNQNPGEAQFYVQNYWYADYPASSYLAVFGEGAGVVVSPSAEFSAGLVQPLAEGTQIGASSSWSNDMFPVLHDGDLHTAWVGQTKYAGLKVKFGANTYYAWVKLSVNANQTFTVYEYAVETSPNTPIAAGDKVGSASIVSVVAADWNVYPNPANTSLTIQAPEGAERVSMFDMSGREVVRLESVSPVQTIDISSLTSGSYIMAITTPEGVSVKKVVVQ